MKLIIFLVIFGIAEIFSIAKLHETMGTSSLIGLYLITTAVGSLFLYLKLPEFKANLKAMRQLDKEFIEKNKDPDYQSSLEDVTKTKSIVFVMFYVGALILIAIPGVITDIIGTLMVMPIISNMILDYRFNKALENVK